MQKGYVFHDHEGFFSIILLTAPYVMTRFIDADTDEEACAALSREFAGHFIPAKRHHRMVARRYMRRHGLPLVLR